MKAANPPDRLTPADERSAFRQFLALMAGIALVIGLAYLLDRSWRWVGGKLLDTSIT